MNGTQRNINNKSKCFTHATTYGIGIDSPIQNELAANISEQQLV